jgi:CRISPR-associated protein Cmr5
MQQHQGQRQTLEQMRGQEAWRRVNQIKDQSEERKDKGSLEKEYRSRVRSLNAMIQINGLGSTLGFLKAKSNVRKVQEENVPHNAPYLLLEHLTTWMSERNFIRSNSTLTEDTSDETDDTENLIHDTDDAMDATNKTPEMSFEGYDGILNWLISKATRDEYRRATTECLAFGLWLRRFAEAELKSSTSPELDEKNVDNTAPRNFTEIVTDESTPESSVERTQQSGK